MSNYFRREGKFAISKIVIFFGEWHFTNRPVLDVRWRARKMFIRRKRRNLILQTSLPCENEDKKILFSLSRLTLHRANDLRRLFGKRGKA